MMGINFAPRYSVHRFYEVLYEPSQGGEVLFWPSRVSFDMPGLEDTAKNVCPTPVTKQDQLQNSVLG
jgi:hypothetical protein